MREFGWRATTKGGEEVVAAACGLNLFLQIPAGRQIFYDAEGLESKSIQPGIHFASIIRLFFFKCKSMMYKILKKFSFPDKYFLTIVTLTTLYRSGFSGRFDSKQD